MKLEANRSAVVAWSPLAGSPGLLAAGTVAGTMSEDFDYSARIEILEVNLVGDQSNDEKSTPSGTMNSLGTASVSERFHKLSWGPCGVQSGMYPKGLLAGGLANGSVTIWSPDAIIKGEEALVTNAVGHGNGPVQGLEFNPFQPNLLASGGSDCEINIWDLQDPTQPTVFNPGNKTSNLPDSPITCVAWNRKVQHILGTTNNNGITVVWDLKAKRGVLNFHDPNKKIRCRAMAWNPDEATQLITASEDDATPIIAIWDLRNTHSPLRELSGHNRGIWAVSWCPVDSDLLLSTGKDNKTLCWNLKNGDVQSEVDHNSSSWNFDVQWSPKIPALLSTCSFEGKIKVVSLQDTRSDEARDNSSVPIFEHSKSTHAPKWLKRPAGVSFGFGGKLAFFKNKQQRTVKLVQIVTDPETVKRAEQLEQALTNDVAALSTFCNDRSKEAKLKEDAETWAILQSLIEGDQQRHKIMAQLGFDEKTVHETAQKFMKETEEKKEDVMEEDEEEEKQEEETAEEEEETSDFEKLLSTGKPKAPKEPKLKQEKVAEILQKIKISVGDDEEGAITKSIIRGKIGDAVNICVNTGRWAAALLLAYYSEETNIWERTQEAYLKKEEGTFISVIGPIVKKDYRELVERSDVGQWKSVLAILCTFAKSDEFSLLVSLLGDRLYQTAKNIEAATVCYVCAGNVEKASEMWMKNGSKSLETTQDFVSKVIVLRKATKQSSPLSEGVIERFSEYAEFLASQGRKKDAIDCLSFVIDKSQTQSQVGTALLDRLSAPKPQQNVQQQRPTTSAQTTPQRTGQFPPGPVQLQTGQQIPPTRTSEAPVPKVGTPAPHSLNGGSNIGSFPVGQVFPPPFQPTGTSTSSSTLPFPGQGQNNSSLSSGQGQSPVRLPSPNTSRGASYGVPPIGNAQYLNPQTKVTPPPFVPPPIVQMNHNLNTNLGGATNLSSNTTSVVSRPPIGGVVPPKPNTLVSGPPIVAAPFNPVPSPSNSGQGLHSVPPPPVGQFVPAPHSHSNAPPSFDPSPHSHSTAPPPSFNAPPTSFNPTTPVAAPPKPVEQPKPVVVQTSEENQALIDTLQSILSRSSQSPDPRVQKLEKDVSKRFEGLFEKLKKNDVSAGLVSQTNQLAQAILSGDTNTSQLVLQTITTSHWEELGTLTIGYKRLIEMTK